MSTLGQSLQSSKRVSVQASAFSETDRRIPRSWDIPGWGSPGIRSLDPAPQKPSDYVDHVSPGHIFPVQPDGVSIGLQAVLSNVSPAVQSDPTQLNFNCMVFQASNLMDRP